MHAKINRGISPNQPPLNKQRQTNNNEPRKYTKDSKESKDSKREVKKSASVRAKKEADRQSNGSRGGSFVAREIQAAKATQLVRKSAGDKVEEGSGHYRVGSGVRSSNGVGFTANPRLKKVGTTNNSIGSVNNPVKKDVTKRPSSASKAKTKPSKISTKPGIRPGTANTRPSSYRPPSPVSRSLKSDHLFTSYSKHKSSKITGATKKLGSSKPIANSATRIKASSTNLISKPKAKPESPGRVVYSKPVIASQNTNSYINYKGLRSQQEQQ